MKLPIKQMRLNELIELLTDFSKEFGNEPIFVRCVNLEGHSIPLCGRQRVGRVIASEDLQTGDRYVSIDVGL